MKATQMVRFFASSRLAVALLCALASIVGNVWPAGGHETDQFSMPPRREFADWGPHFNRFFYDAIDGGVKKTNEKIRAAIEGGQSPAQIAALQSTEEITLAVGKEFPIAMNIINGLDKLTVKPAVKQRYPGRVPGDRPVVHNVRQHFEIPFNPLRPWYASTVRLYDTHLGADKIGHFSDMGMIYWKKYHKARGEGKGAEEAVGDAVRIGTHGFIMSERGILGYVTAGA
jgi:hypothetical protein